MNILQKIRYEFEIDKRNLKEQILIEKNNIHYIKPTDSIEKMICFLISAEDHRFYYHFGFDIIAILRAIRNKLIWNKSEGASTIEQQLVRVLTNNYQRNLKRKIKEIILAYSLKKNLSKREIALIYLNIAYYGTNLQGLNKVLSKFDLHSENEINDQICAEVVARLKYPEPSNYNIRKLDLIRKRTSHIKFLYNKHNSSKYLNYYGKYN